MLTITPIRTPERVSDHLARVHCIGDKAVPVTAWFGAGAADKGLSGPVDGAHLKARGVSRATTNITQRERAPRQAGFDLEAFVTSVRQRTARLPATSATLRAEGL